MGHHTSSVALTEPSLPSGLLQQQKTLDMDQLIRSFLREQNEGQQQSNNRGGGCGSSTHQSEQAIPISSIIDAYHHSQQQMSVGPDGDSSSAAEASHSRNIY